MERTSVRSTIPRRRQRRRPASSLAMTASALASRVHSQQKALARPPAASPYRGHAARAIRSSALRRHPGLDLPFRHCARHCARRCLQSASPCPTRIGSIQQGYAARHPGSDDLRCCAACARRVGCTTVLQWPGSWACASHCPRSCARCGSPTAKASGPRSRSAAWNAALRCCREYSDSAKAPSACHPLAFSREPALLRRPPAGRRARRSFHQARRKRTARRGSRWPAPAQLH